MAKLVYIGEKDRPVAFPANAIREYELITGKPFIGSDFFHFDFRIPITYVGLKWGLYKGDGVEPKPEFNEFQVGDWLGLEMADDSPYGKIIEILTDSLPKAKPKKEEAGNNPA